jgi:hypothetical protein
MLRKRVSLSFACRKAVAYREFGLWVAVIQLEQRVTRCGGLADRDEDVGHHTGDRRPDGDVLGTRANRHLH